MGKRKVTTNNAEKILKKVAELRNVRGDLNSGIRLLEKELKQVKEEEKPQLLLALAHLYIDTGKTEKAEKVFRKAIFLAGKRGDFLNKADSQRKFAYLLWHKNANKRQALALCQAAQKTLQKIPKTKDSMRISANIYATFGNIYGDSRDLEKALLWYKKAKIASQKSGFKEREVTIFGDLGNVYSWLGDFKKAEAFLRKAVKRARVYYRHAYPSSLLRLGRLFLNKQNPRRDLKRAKDFTKKSLEVAVKEGWRREQADAYEHLAKIYLEIDDKNKAIKMLNKALKIYQELRYLWNVGSVKKQIKEIV